MARNPRNNPNLRSKRLPGRYFASGSNHEGEIQGLAAVGHSIGVAAASLRKPSKGSSAAAKWSSLSARSVEALKQTAGTVPVFVDSGAFSEVAFGASGPYTVLPIEHDEWIRRLDLYAELAAVLTTALYVVAPDKVAFEGETLGRMSTYRKQIQAIAATGAKVLVPLQGADKVDFWKRAQWALGLFDADGAIPAFPMAKNATDPADVVAFCAAVKPSAIHLLGLGPYSSQVDVPTLLAAIKAASPDTDITLDSCLIKRMVGVTSGLKPYSVAQHTVRDEAAAQGETLSATDKKRAGFVLMFSGATMTGVPARYTGDRMVEELAWGRGAVEVAV